MKKIKSNCGRITCWKGVLHGKFNSLNHKANCKKIQMRKEEVQQRVCVAEWKKRKKRTL